MIIIFIYFFFQFYYNLYLGICLQWELWSRVNHLHPWVDNRLKKRPPPPQDMNWPVLTSPPEKSPSLLPSSSIKVLYTVYQVLSLIQYSCYGSFQKADSAISSCDNSFSAFLFYYHTVLRDFIFILKMY